MIEILHSSMNDINTMSDAHNNQAEVIKSTVKISEDIADSIQKENIKFNNINSMVENNAEDIIKMTEQVGVINSMVEEINKLLNQEE